MALGCIVRGGDGPPNVIEDTSTLQVSLDNQGMATLSITILTKSSNPISKSTYSYQLGNKKFCGFIAEDSPRQLDGSEYYEHNIVARGMIC